MEDLCRSEKAAKAPQTACQTALGADEWTSTLWNCLKSFISHGKKIHSENDLIISLWKYTSGIINCLRRKSDHLATALAWKFLNLRVGNIFSRMVPIHSHAVRSLFVDLNTLPCLCPIFLVAVHFCVNSAHTPVLWAGQLHHLMTSSFPSGFESKN